MLLKVMIAVFAAAALLAFFDATKPLQEHIRYCKVPGHPYWMTPCRYVKQEADA